MPKNPGREELIQRVPVKIKNIPDAMDFTHRVVKHPRAIPGNGRRRAYAGFLPDRLKHSRNGIPDTRRNYTGNTSSARERPGAGAGCGGGKER